MQFSMKYICAECWAIETTNGHCNLGFETKTLWSYHTPYYCPTEKCFKPLTGKNYFLAKDLMEKIP